ncbi:MAG: glycosyltransferase family 2 protein [Gemmatimonadaceae bacterium]
MSIAPAPATPEYSRTVSAIHIVCSVYNGERYLDEFVQSVQAQTVSNWMLWVRDDGSRDTSATLLKQFAATDERVRLFEVPGTNLGVVASFNRALQQVPTDARYIMFADQDDVWLPQKIEYTLSAMMLGEEHSSGPLLVHTDMTVVNESLEPMAESFWEFAHINPEATALQRLLVRNAVTGATLMINRALRERVGEIPTAAVMHDWWIACVAAAFGSLIAVTTPTMLYRQHALNAIGASQPGSSAAFVELPGAVSRAVRKTGRVRSDIFAAATQAGAFLACFGNELTPEDRAFATEYASIPLHTFFRRKLDIARLHLQREDGWLKNVGLLLRA